MTTAENIAASRRVRVLEQAINSQALLWIRTTIVVCERVEEPAYLTVGEVLEAAEHEPEVREVRRFADLELLIDPVSQTRKLRHKLSPAGREGFDRLRSHAKVRLIDVEIRCHEAQVAAILSDAPTVAAFGGNRSGKTVILQWWLFRRWMLRGGPPGTNGKPRVFWWVGPDWTKVIEEGVYGMAGPDGLGGGLWPDPVFLDLKPIPLTKKNPAISLIDGSKLVFKHANHSGKKAGSNLKSANVVDAAVDELGAITSEANWHQVQIRVSQTGGHVAASTTRVPNHWSHASITERAKEVGADVIGVFQFDVFDNPWMTFSRIWQLFLNDRTISRHQLEHVILPADDPKAAALGVITNPKSLREHLGIETATSPFMWAEWTDALIYTGTARRHTTIDIYRDERPIRLLNITREVLARHWPRATREGHRFDCFAGVDFNVRGHAVILELFGEGKTPNEAIANEASWTVLVAEEVQVDGTTLALAKQLRAQSGGPAPVWYDGHGATGHAARGTGNGTTDADILRQEGFTAGPTNGTNQDGKPLRLSQIDSRNVMHGLMKAGRFYVHERCVGLIDAMHNDMRLPDGRIDKRSSPDSDSDFRSGFSDAARYAIWPIFRAMFQQKP